MTSECCICFELIRSTDNRPVATLCGHIFHEHCINSCFAKQNLCPQCNQPAYRYQLIRLFINQSENADVSKDDLIEKLKLQLNELTEKAQLQYELIASLNKQISLMESKNPKIKKESTSPQTTTASASNNIHSRTLPKNSSKFADSLTTFESIPTSTKTELYKAIGRVIFGRNTPEITFKPTAVISSFKDPTIFPLVAIKTFSNTQQLPTAPNDTLGSDLNFTSSTTFKPLTSASTSKTIPSIFGNNALQLPQASKSAESAKSTELSYHDNKKITVSDLSQNAAKLYNLSKFTSQAPMLNFSTGFSASSPSTINGDASASLPSTINGDASASASRHSTINGEASGSAARPSTINGEASVSAFIFKFEEPNVMKTTDQATCSLASSIPVSSSANLFTSSTANSNATTKAKNSSVFKTSPFPRNGYKPSTPSFVFEGPSTQSISDNFPFGSLFSRHSDATAAESTSVPTCNTKTNVAPTLKELVGTSNMSAEVINLSELLNNINTNSV